MKIINQSKQSTMLTGRKLIGALAVGLMMVAMSHVEASVIYTFNAAPITLGYDSGGGGGTGVVGYRNTTPPFAGSANAQIEFANALAPNSTTVFRSELGGYDLLGAPNTGGVLSYSSPSVASFGVSSDITPYLVGEDALTVRVFRYSTLEGSLTTDALGNITAWDVQFLLYELSGGSAFLWKGPSPPPSDFPALSISSLDMATFLNSASTAFNINVGVLDGVVGDTTLSATVFDRVFGDPGPVQLTRFTTAAGTWSSNATNNVPVPLSATLLLIGFAALCTRQRFA
jgi:hypothetical protein